MQPFSVSYTKAINKQQYRAGPLFQGPYKCKHVDNLEYLELLTRYIHRNPVNAGDVSSAVEWAYSSFLDYIGLREGSLPFMEPILENFPSPNDYRRYVEEVQDEKVIDHLVFDE